MALSSHQPLKCDPIKSLCTSEKCKKKILKLTESRDALRKAVNIQDLAIKDFQAKILNHAKECEEERLRTKLETEEKLKEYNARVSLEKQVSTLESEIATIRQKLDDDAQDGNESIESLRACIADKEKEISELKKLFEVEKKKVESERKNVEKEKKKAAEALKLLEVEKNKKVEKGEQTARSEADKEKEISELKELFEAEKKRAESERKNAEKEKKKATEAWKLLEVEKGKNNEKEEQIARVGADKEMEIRKLKELFEAEKKRADSERKNAEKEKKKADEARKLLEVEKKKNVEKEEQIARVGADREKEIGKLKELFEAEKKRADSERKNAEKEKKKADEVRQLLEVEKKKNVEKGVQIARIEAEKKSEEHRIQLCQLDKEVNEAKAKLAFEMSAFEEANKRFEAEKRKMLAEKRNAEVGMAKLNEKLEAEKQKANQEKGRADAEVVKAESQKALAEDNWKKFMEEKRRVDQMSQQLEEDKQTIDALKHKIADLSSARELIGTAGATVEAGSKAESTKTKLLKSQLKLEKLRVKNAKQKFKLQASRHNILRRELGHLKIDSIQLLHRLDMIDASFSAVSRSTHDQIKYENMLYTQNPNVMRQVCNLDSSQMRSQFENELPQMDGCDPLSKNMQHFLALSGGNCSESNTGINSKPLDRGSNKTKLQSSAINSSSESFSDGQMMGSQETTTFPVTASTKLNEEIFNARQSLCNPSDKSVNEHHRKRKSIHDIANLPSQNLPDLHGLLYERVNKWFAGGREMHHNLNNLQEQNDRAHKKRKKSDREKADEVPQINTDGKKGGEKSEAAAYQNKNVVRSSSCPSPYGLETTQTCGDRICDAANNFDSMICFDNVTDGNYMKLLELENAAYEECYQRAMDSPLSPSLPEAQEDMFSPRTDLFPSPSSCVINVESNSNEQCFDVSGVSSNSKDKPTQPSKTEGVKLLHMGTLEKSRDAQLAEGGIGPLHKKLSKFFVVFSNLEDNSTISRIVFATNACIASCNLATQVGWEVKSILTALRKEEELSQKEKASVLLTLLLFNFVTASTLTFGKLWDGNLVLCMKSYTEHICTVLSDVEARTLLLENYPLQELLRLIEDFLVEGKVTVNNEAPAETLSDCDFRINGHLDCANKFSSAIASSEQLISGSIILASICAATNHVGFLFHASYDILRLCNWDSLVVLTILHIFAYLGGEKFFVSASFRLMITVLKSLVMFLEGENISVATASCPHSIYQLHTQFGTNAKCPFSEGAESVDIVACLLLEEIKGCLLLGMDRVDLSNSRFTLDNYNAGQRSNPEAVQCAINTSCDVPCCLEKCTSSATQPHVLENVTLCHLGDVLSLVELVANKLSWQWTVIKLVPQLLNMVDSCVEEKFVIAIIVLLGQLGRIGVIAGGYGDVGVENLRCKLFAYLCRASSMKRLSLQIATATALFSLLPFDLETLLHTNTSLPAYSKSVSDDSETLRKWFSGIDKDQQELLSSILSRSSDVYNK